MGWQQKRRGMRVVGRGFARLTAGGRCRGSQVSSRRPLKVELLEMRRLLAASPRTAPPLLDSVSGDDGSSLAAVSEWSVRPHPLRVPSIEVTPTNEITPYTTISESGPSSNRVDIVFLGDGYAAAEIETDYVSHIDVMLSHMFNSGEDPFPRYANFFNVHRVNVVSDESGADKPADGVYVDTALDARYSCAGIRRLICISNGKADDALSAGLLGTSIDVDMRMVTVNDSEYGGSGGRYAVYAGGNSSAAEIALHEIGHSFSDLADEYGGSGTYSGSEPREINVTKDPSGQKWSEWLGYSQPAIGTIGAYEGGRYYDNGIYRPSFNSKMRSLNRPFDAVSREQFIRDIYDLVDPLDGWRDNEAPITGSDPELWIDAVDPGVIQTEWFVDGELVAGASGESFRLRDHGFVEGEFVVTARSYDPVSWVRRGGEALEQSVSWELTVTPPPSVASVTINGGDKQRSSLDSVAIEFDTEVVIDWEGAEPFRVGIRDDALATMSTDAEVIVSGGRTIVTLTFVPETEWTNPLGSLRNGWYELAIDSAAVVGVGGALDGNGDGAAGGDFLFGENDADGFYRKYGDADGDGTVNLYDFRSFRAAFGGSTGDTRYRHDLDDDGNGVINLYDFRAFRSGFGR